MTLTLPAAEWISHKHDGQNFVLLHGMVMAPAFWHAYAPEITLHGRTAAYPLPGHHPWSLEAPGEPIARASVTEALAAAIRRDFGGRPVTLIGHSTGGFVSLLLALDHPELVRSVILMGAFACGRFEGQERLAARLLRLPHMGPYLFRQFFRRWISTSEQFRWGSVECVYDKSCPWEDDHARAAMEKVRENLLRGRSEDIAACIRFMSGTSLLTDLQLLRMPVLNLVGANDAIVPPAHQLHVSKLLPQAQTVILRACGHLPMVEHKMQTDRIVESFVHARQTRFILPSLRKAGGTHMPTHLDRLLNALANPMEQIKAGGVQPAQNAKFPIGLGEVPNEHHSCHHPYSSTDRRSAELGS
ncbi:alpha/beta hydrolase fold containing protein [Rhizobium sp. PDO1-076]|uniref:alpha/beta fold hydrolase n=1 Tax=Rhizobium sp. PDO1-076 TaxID=1125979 RepID=UPI00024E3B3E|nr:alpha/beta hydrolase [Rhizobium sp. PDO1-076]EHS50786.1 alpha/beta hydrolase fold containing protein [Rhizobium sp. PDO1-076]